MGEPRERAPAKADGAPAESGAEVWLFSVRLLGARFAFEATLVTEVVRLGPLTRLPAAPSFLPGVFTHRGEVLPVLDIPLLVGQAAVPIGPSTRVAIVYCSPWKVAVVAEGVEGLVGLPKAHLEPPPSNGTGMAEFLSAVARDERGSIAVIDLPRLVEAARSRSVPA